MLKVAHARLNKSGARPLGRTQSAPLPLGHPVLHGAQIPPAAMGLTQQQFEQYIRDRAAYEQQQQHNMLKQVKTQNTLNLSDMKLLNSIRILFRPDSFH